MSRWETAEELEEHTIKQQYYELEARRKEVARREKDVEQKRAHEAAKRDEKLAQQEDAMYYFTTLVKVRVRGGVRYPACMGVAACFARPGSLFFRCVTVCARVCRDGTRATLSRWRWRSGRWRWSGTRP